MRTLTLPLRTERLTVRDFVQTDFHAIHAYSSDPRVTRYLFFGPRDQDNTADYLEGLLASQRERPRTRFELAVEETASGRVIGACDLSFIERNVVDLGYMLGTPDWGKGYATEISLALVDAAIIFADLLLPLEPMGLPFEFLAGEGPHVHHPVRTAEDVRALRTDRAADLAYVARAIEKVAAHFRDRLGIIGFCGAPFTLASYMIEGGGSRNYIYTKQMMYRDTTAWRSLLDKIVVVLTEYCRMQVQAGADVIQIFDSWVGSLGFADYKEYAFEVSKRLVRAVQQMGVPVIYFGVETAGLLGEMAATGADVIGLDWRQPLDEGWRAVGHGHAVQGNLDPITLFAPVEVLELRVKEILRAANGRPGHIFNLGHGIVPNTPVENVQAVVRMVKEFRLETANG